MALMSKNNLIPFIEKKLEIKVRKGMRLSNLRVLQDDSLNSEDLSVICNVG